MILDEALTLLRATPDRLAAIAGTPAQLRTRPAPEEWSAVEVLAHLRSCCDVWGDYLQRMVAEDHPTIRAVNPTTWITSTDYDALEWAPSLKAFVAQRRQLLALVDGLTAEQWARAGTLTGGGAPRPRTAESFVIRLARHERPHLTQLERALLVSSDGS